MGGCAPSCLLDLFTPSLRYLFPIPRGPRTCGPATFFARLRLLPMAAAPPRVTEVKVLEPGPLSLTTVGLLTLVVTMNLMVPYLLARQFVFPATAFTLGVTAGLVIFLRTISGQTFKTVAYLAVGVSVFWSAGASYAPALTPNGPNFLATTAVPGSYAAAASLGLASAVGLVILLNEGAKRVWVFGLTGFAALLFAAATGQAPGGSRGVITLILLAVLWTLLSYLIVRGLSGGSATKYRTGDKVRAGLRAGLVSLPAYLLLLFAFLLAAKMASTEGLTIGSAASAVVRDLRVDPVTSGLYFGTAAVLYVLFQLLVVAVAALLYDGGLHARGVERQLLKSGELRFVRKVAAPPPKPAPAPAKAADPYAELRVGIKRFAAEFEKTDRLTAAQLLNRYKSEFEILAEKHPGGSKAEVEKLLKEIETEFAKKYA